MRIFRNNMFNDAEVKRVMLRFHSSLIHSFASRQTRAHRLLVECNVINEIHSKKLSASDRRVATPTPSAKHVDFKLSTLSMTKRKKYDSLQ